MALGGRAAEEVVFAVVSSGAQNDLERVTKMAYAQVSDFGMSEAVGPLSFGSSDDSNTLYKPFSEQTARLIDDEAQSIVERNYVRAVDMLIEHKEKLTALAEELLSKEVIGTEELVTILGPRPHNKSVDYEEFMHAAWQSTTAQAGAVSADVPDTGGASSTGDVAAAAKEVDGV